MKLKWPFISQKRDDEMTDEMAFHVESKTRELVNAGMSEADARLEARRRFGSVLKHKEAGHEVRTGRLFEDLVHDLRFMGRTLRRSPGFTLTLVSMLALGIGANTAVFSVVNSVLLKPLPYPGADRIVVLRTAFHTRGETQRLVTIANFRDWRDRSSSFEAMSSYRPGESSVTTGAAAEYGRIALVDAQFFRVFAVQPAIGRTFRPDEIESRRATTGDHQPFVLAKPPWRRPARTGANDSRCQYSTIDRRCTAAWISVSRRNRCVASAGDPVDQSHVT